MNKNGQVPPARKPSAQAWVVPRAEPVWIAAALGIGLFVLFSFLHVNRPPDLAPWREAATAVVVLLFIAILIYFENLLKLFKSKTVGTWALFIILGLLTNASCWLGIRIWDEHLMGMLIIVASVTLNLRDAVAYSIGLILAWLVTICVVFSLSFERAVANVTSFMPLWIMMFGFGQAFRALESAKARAKSQKKRADELLETAHNNRFALERVREKELSLEAARNRIDIADGIQEGLDRRLNLLLAELKGARAKLGGDEVDTAASLERCRVETKAAIESLRTSVAMLRQRSKTVAERTEVQAR